MTFRCPLRAAGARLVALVVGVFAAQALAADPPALPAHDRFALPGDTVYRIEDDGTLAWIGARAVPGTEPSRMTGPGCWRWELVARRWQPATGRTQETPLGLPGLPIAQVPVPDGVLSVSTMDCEDPARLRLMLQRRDGSQLVTETREPLEAMRMILLPLGQDGAVIVTRRKDTRHVTPFVVRPRSGALVLERRAVLPIAYRGDFTSEMTADGRLMLLGGSDAEYRGCSPCRADTHFLDLATDVWKPGPPMLEARSELAAARLPDGSILVSGGWTTRAGWGIGPSATAELWNPRTNRFEALPPMPSGTGRHRFMTLPWMPGRLYAIEGVNGSAHVFDLATRTWRTAGAWTEGSEEGGCGFFPFRFEGHTYAWLRNRTDGHYATKACADQEATMLSLLRPFGTDVPAPAPPPASALITFRAGAAFVPEGGPGGVRPPALVIGGHTHAGMNNHVMSSTVEAVDRQGRLWALPSLRHARSDAKAFRVGDGVLVAGGIAGWAHLDPEGAARALPMEWLPDANPAKAAAWTELDGPAPASDSVLAQGPDGTLLEFARAGANVTQWKATLQDGRVTLRSAPWPPLPRARRNDTAHPMRVSVLADGRVIVAGGLAQAEKIALYTPDADRADAKDTYVGIGPYLPARRHDIYDPATGRWRLSAPATMPGGSAFVFPDGRVWKTVTDFLPDPSNAGNAIPRVTHELSQADGSGWRTLDGNAAPGSRLAANERRRVFSVDGEVFAAGDVPGLEQGQYSTSIEWLDPQSARWQPVWTSGERENWRTHLGRVIVHALPGGKTVVLPVEGF